MDASYIPAGAKMIANVNMSPTSQLPAPKHPFPSAMIIKLEPFQRAIAVVMTIRKLIRRA